MGRSSPRSPACSRSSRRSVYRGRPVGTVGTRRCPTPPARSRMPREGALAPRALSAPPADPDRLAPAACRPTHPATASSGISTRIAHSRTLAHRSEHEKPERGPFSVGGPYLSRVFRTPSRGIQECPPLQSSPPAPAPPAPARAKQNQPTTSAAPKTPLRKRRHEFSLGSTETAAYRRR